MTGRAGQPTQVLVHMSWGRRAASPALRRPRLPGRAAGQRSPAGSPALTPRPRRAMRRWCRSSPARGLGRLRPARGHLLGGHKPGGRPQPHYPPTGAGRRPTGTGRRPTGAGRRPASVSAGSAHPAAAGLSTARPTGRPAAPMASPAVVAPGQAAGGRTRVRLPAYCPAPPALPRGWRRPPGAVTPGAPPGPHGAVRPARRRCGVTPRASARDERYPPRCASARVLAFLRGRAARGRARETGKPAPGLRRAS